MLAYMPHKFQKGVTHGFVFFSNAAERPERPGRFRVGVVGLKETHKSFKCPRSMFTLQHAKLWGVYLAKNIAVCTHRNATGGRRQGSGLAQIAQWLDTRRARDTPAQAPVSRRGSYDAFSANAQ